MTRDEVIKLAFFDELQKIHEARGEQFDMAKFAGLDIDELIKEALLREALQKTVGGLRQAGQAVATKVSPNRRFIQSVGQIDKGLGQTAQQALKQQGTGARMQQWGKSMRQTPVQRVQAAGLKLAPGEAQQITDVTKRMGGTSGAKRMIGGTVEGAGAHMAHSPGWKMALNPLGVPMGGAMEGFVRQGGREAVAAGGQLAAGGRHTAGRALGRVGTGLQRAAPVVGQVGEMATMAATHLPSVAGNLGVSAVHGLTGGGGFLPTFAGKGVGAGITKGLEMAGRGASQAVQRMAPVVA